MTYKFSKIQKIPGENTKPSRRTNSKSTSLKSLISPSPAGVRIQDGNHDFFDQKLISLIISSANSFLPRFCKHDKEVRSKKLYETVGKFVQPPTPYTAQLENPPLASLAGRKIQMPVIRSKISQKLSKSHNSTCV